MTTPGSVANSESLDVEDEPDAAAQGALQSHPWLSFLGRRLLRLAISLWVLITASFFMIQLVPGDPIRAAMGQLAPSEVVEARREALGLNDPLPTQYVHYLVNTAHGDLGESIVSPSVSVADTIQSRLPATIEISLLAFLVTMLVAVPVGVVVAALTRGGRRRRAELAFSSSSIVFASIPDFIVAVGLVYVFGVTLGWLPVAGNDGISSYILPVLALSIGPIAVMARIVRVEMLAVLDADFLRTARSKRLKASRIYLRHALPNALTATLTISGLLLGGLIAGTVLVENVMAWPGVGSTIVSSILSKDYPMVQGIVLVYGIAVLVINLMVDVALAALDPRSAIREG